MGCCKSKNRRADEFYKIAQETGMATEDVSTAYQNFKKEVGSSKRLSFEKFKKVLASMNTNLNGTVDDYARHLFDTLDVNKDGKASFSEVMVAFYTLSPAGDAQKRLKLVFKMYDQDRKKALSKSNVYTITRAVFKMQGRPLLDSTINEGVDSLFKQCDLNADRRISEAEFLRAAGPHVEEWFEFEDDDDDDDDDDGDGDGDEDKKKKKKGKKK